MPENQMPTERPDAPVPAPTTDTADAGSAKVIYILYLVGIVVGLTTLIGVIMAYVKKGDAPPWLASHYRFQIRTFWIGVLYSIIGMVTLPLFFLGGLIMLFVLVWLIMRCVKGMSLIDRNQPMENVETWLFP